MQTVLVVGHDQHFTRLIQAQLSAAGYRVGCCDRGETALRYAEGTAPDLILLDLLLLGEDELSLLRRIRSTEVLGETRVIVVSAKCCEADRVTGLEAGADDYIVKPLSPRELVARVKAVLRVREQSKLVNVLEFGGLRVDSAALVVTLNGEVLPTTLTEFRMLECLLRAAGRVVPREQLLNILSPEDESPSDSRKLDVYISRLRGKIERTPHVPRCIVTVRGIGYRFQPHATDRPKRG